ncbi:hypothetical protein PR001_g22752 [Phytophthora rubi]|nr:hypothetical protein PR001_g22752 [Phytophthora rubi]
MNTSTVPATVTVDKGKLMESTKAVPKDGSVAAVRKAVAAQLNDELAARESGRAERYVSTMTPAMATLHYVHQMDDDGGDDRAGGAVMNRTAEETAKMKNAVTTMTVADKGTVTALEAVPADTDEVPTSEEGGGTMSDGRVTEEGATVVTETTKIDGTTEAEPSPLGLGMELTDEVMVKLGSVAAVRMAGKRSKRAAKQL